MSTTQKDSAHASDGRLALVLNIYGRVMAAVMMVLGLRQWAIIVGVIEGQAGAFEAMPTPWKIATMHLAVVDLVASVGLWQRVAWGNVVWFYAALAAIAMHTIFISTFGSDLVAVGFHTVTVVAYILLFVAERRGHRN
jgi:hypothetical protein